jgi:hypothetical protein
MTEEIEIGFQAYVSDGGEEFGAVRAIGDHRGELIIYVENAGDFAVPFDAVESVHSGKVILNCAKLGQRPSPSYWPRSRRRGARFRNAF